MELDKITDSNNASSRRRYEDACGTAHAMDLIGERWALLVMRELMMGPKRFSDIKADLPGISANVLTQRLEGLEAAGIVVRRLLPPPASIQVYELTEWGYQSKPIMGALGRWATRSPWHDTSRHMSSASLMLSFQAMARPDLAGDFAGAVGFDLGRETFVLKFHNGMPNPQRGDPAGADVVFRGEPRAVAAAVYGGVPLAALEAEGALAITGERALAERFVTLFPLPPKAPLPG